MKPYYEHGGIEIYHGDCREILPQLAFNLVVTDPPYGISLDNHDPAVESSRPNGWNIVGDHNDELAYWITGYCAQRRVPLICFGSPKKNGLLCKQMLVWDKGPAVGGGGDPENYWKYTFELIYVSGTGKLNGDRDSAVLRYWITPADTPLHPAQKPISLLKYLLSKTTWAGTLVCDPFMGSGSTLEAAKSFGQNAIGIEIEERYCELAAKRLSQEVFQFGANAATTDHAERGQGPVVELSEQKS